MAAYVNAPDVDKMMSEHQLDCPICSKHLQEPKILDCLHSFCLGCLKDLRVRQGVENPTLTCPVCSHKTKVGDVADLLDYLTLSALVEEVTMKEQLLEGQGSRIRCQACDGKSPAMSRCMDCDQFLCQECRETHESLAATAHNIYSLAQFESGEIAYKSKLREHIPNCSKHLDQKLEVYCDTCNQLLCRRCSVTDHSGHAHSLKGLPEASDKCKQIVAEMVARAEKCQAAFATAADEMRRSLLDLNITCFNTKKRITKKADREVARIRAEEEKILNELKQTYFERVGIIKSAKAAYTKEVISTERKQKQVDNIVAQASCYEILKLQQKLLDNMRELISKQPEKVPTHLSIMEFEDGDEGSLGRLVLEETELKGKVVGEESHEEENKWHLKKELWTFQPDYSEFTVAWYVSAFSSGKILVADINHKQLITCTPSPEGESKLCVNPKGLEIKGLTDPRNVAVNADDQIVVLDGPKVKVFNRNYQLLDQFTPGGGPDRQPTCLAVDKSTNLIAVGYADTELIHLHDPKGSFIKMLPAPMINSYLTISRKRLIYTNWGKKKLLSMDYNGGIIFSVDISNDMPDWGPMGVCCDNEGSIYVAVCGDWPSLGEILHFGPDGMFIGRAIKGHSNLRDITVTPDQDLVVAAVESVKIYHLRTDDNEH
ncbi:E3 ubiquitin-protein ligase TRIM56-like [Patiria miniata]|uniref:Tripartite motif-containing protein 2-like n=1 Tax=Patiria miniata TaxID=46514 RepID=A0A914A5S5_PATMI|nr:E3 ubiquitin-protein ligase TRIM56-like [Patiria miniata]